MMMISSGVLIQQYFNRRRVLAATLANSGFSVGGLTFGPLTAALLQACAVRGTLLIIGGIYFQMSVFCSLFRPAPITVGKTKSAKIADGSEEMELAAGDIDGPSKLQRHREQTVEQCFADNVNDHHSKPRAARLLSWFRRLFADVFDFTLLRRVHFQLFIISTFCLFLGLLSYMQHTPSRAAGMGIELWMVSVLPTLYSCATGVSRLISGLIANMPCTRLVLQFAISLTLSGIVQITTFLTRTFTTIALHCILQGTTNGQ